MQVTLLTSGFPLKPLVAMPRVHTYQADARRTTGLKDDMKMIGTNLYSSWRRGPIRTAAIQKTSLYGCSAGN
jgi:hypothetical protein